MIIFISRQLESLIRLAEAHAKLRFSHKVEVIDVEEALRLHQEALKQFIVDPKTGTIDASLLTNRSNTGLRRETVKNTLKELISKKGNIQRLNWMKTWNELKFASDLVSIKSRAKQKITNTKIQFVL